jgi:hypothetical protein
MNSRVSSQQQLMSLNAAAKLEQKKAIQEAREVAKIAGAGSPTVTRSMTMHKDARKHSKSFLG